MAGDYPISKDEFYDCLTLCVTNMSISIALGGFFGYWLCNLTGIITGVVIGGLFGIAPFLLFAI